MPKYRSLRLNLTRPKIPTLFWVKGSRPLKLQIPEKSMKDISQGMQTQYIVEPVVTKIYPHITIILHPTITAAAPLLHVVPPTATPGVKILALVI